MLETICQILFILDKNILLRDICDLELNPFPSPSNVIHAIFANRCGDSMECCIIKVNYEVALQLVCSYQLHSPVKL